MQYDVKNCIVQYFIKSLFSFTSKIKNANVTPLIFRNLVLLYSAIESKNSFVE